MLGSKVAEWLLWSAMTAVIYVYIGYPLAAMVLSRLLRRRVRKAEILPSVTIIIPAHNEERSLARTLENKLSLDYPKERLAIIVVSDASSDGTDEIARSYAERGVALIRQEPRQGKTAGLNLAVPKARGEIVVFSDANSLYARDALRRLVANFADSKVGYVTGKMVYVNPGGSITGDGCSGYMKYENFLRAVETQLGSVVGVDGGIDAVRKALYVPMRPDQLPDFVLPLRVFEQGYRVVYEPAALLNEESLGESRDEFRMRVRVSLRSINALRDMRCLLNPFRHPLYAWQLLSHKGLRYGVFFFLAGAYGANVLLAGQGQLYSFLFAAQNVFYVSAFVGFLLEKGKIHAGIFFVPFYFCLLNLAAALAFAKFLNNETQSVWTPRTG